MEKFTEQELHCIARLLQGAAFGENNLFDGCAFCKFNCATKEDPNPNYDILFAKLTKMTGVDLLPMKTTIVHSKFPYKKFLKNANKNIREYFRNYFKSI